MRRPPNGSFAINVYTLLFAIVGVSLLFTFFKLGQLNGTVNIVNARTFDSESVRPMHPQIERLSWEPRAWLYHKFLTEEQCEHIISLAEKDVTRSKVVGKDGKAVENPVRSSYGTFLSKHANDKVVKYIEEKIADWTHLPIENGEVMYFLRYEVGQEYKAHMDYFSRDPDGELWIGEQGQRIATVVMYLSDVEEGGETFFPDAVGGELRVKPKKGDALLFWSVLPNGTEDPRSKHGAKPVIKGVKYALTKWIRQNKARR